MVHRIHHIYCGAGWAVLFGLTLLAVTSGCSLHHEKRGMIVRGDWALEFNRTPYIGSSTCSDCDPTDENCEHKKKGFCSLLSRDPDTKPTLPPQFSKPSVSNSPSSPPQPPKPPVSNSPPPSGNGGGVVGSPLPTSQESGSIPKPSSTSSVAVPSTGAAAPVRLVPNLQTGQMVAVPVCVHQPTCVAVMVPSLGQPVPLCSLQQNRPSPLQPTPQGQQMVLVPQQGSGSMMIPVSLVSETNDVRKTAVSSPTLHAVPTKPVFQPVVQRQNYASPVVP